MEGSSQPHEVRAAPLMDFGATRYWLAGESMSSLIELHAYVCDAENILRKHMNRFP
jgi:hypothetical protein